MHFSRINRKRWPTHKRVRSTCNSFYISSVSSQPTWVATVFLYPLSPCTCKGVYTRTHTCTHAYTHKCHGKLVIRKSVTEFPSVLNFCLFSGQSLGSEPLCGFTSTLSISVPGNRLFPSFFSSISFFFFYSLPPLCFSFFPFFLSFFLSFCASFFPLYLTYLSTYHRITIVERER